MSDTDNEKPKLGMRQPLGLKRTVETGQVKQSFSHGRQNTVVVEVKRRRILGPGGAPVEAPVEQQVVDDPVQIGARLADRAGLVIELQIDVLQQVVGLVPGRAAHQQVTGQRRSQV